MGRKREIWFNVLTVGLPYLWRLIFAKRKP